MLYGTVEIGGQEYRVCTAASVNVNYYNVFHEDFISLMSSDSPQSAVTPFIQMAFIMIQRGEKTSEEVDRMTMKDYQKWLDGFTFGDLVNSLGDIQKLYLESTVGTVDSKKNSARQNAR